MHLLLASSGSPWSTVGIILAVATGAVGAIAALLRVGPERNSAAVVQAQTAMETMVELNRQLEKALARCNEVNRELRRQLDSIHTPAREPGGL